MPSARWRSTARENVLVMIASVEGMISAAPMPIPALAAISIPTEPENAAKVEPTANSASPSMKVRLRPTLSARLPATSISPPNTSTYASTIHWSSLVLAWSLRTSVGSTTFRTVLSSETISSGTQRTPSAIQRLRDPLAPTPAS